jgi:hypothetical protein
MTRRPALALLPGRPRPTMCVCALAGGGGAGHAVIEEGC